MDRFVSNFTNRLDAKGRVSIPASFRAVLARDGFEALMAGKDHIVAGSLKNKVASTLGHLLPDTVNAQLHRKQTEPGSGDG